MGLAFSPDGNTLATANRPDAAVLWNIQNPVQPTRGPEFQFHSGKDRWAEAVAFSPKGKWLAIAGYNCTLILWPMPSQ
jgi:WD40 repeat protein